MARIYRRTDRIKVKIGEVTLHLAPMTFHQKTEVQSAMLTGRKNLDVKEATRGVVLAMKYSIKGIDGAEDSDGNQYKLDFEGDELSDACVDDLLNLGITDKMSLVCASLTRSIPTEFTDEHGNKIEGVELVKSSDKEAESKNA